MFIQPKNLDTLKPRLAERPLALFGMGGMGHKIADFCDVNRIPVACFADNNVTKQNKARQDRVVILPQEMQENYPTSNVVISSAIYYGEMKRQLEDLGFPEERLLSYKIFLPDELTWLDLDKTANWEKMRVRVKRLSEWIGGDVRSVADYGAGEMFLKTLLLPDVEYFPVDYIRRSEETILCDLNSGVFPDLKTDAAVLSGVLEFITTAESLLSHVCETTDAQILLSYITSDHFPDSNGRRASAYVNDFSQRQVIDFLAQKGFGLKNMTADPAHMINTLFLFEKLIG